MASRWLLSGFVGFFIGFGFPWIRTCRPFMSDDQASTHVVPDQSRLQEERLQEEDQTYTQVVPDEPRLQEKTVPEEGQAQPSRLHYEGLQLYSQPASPDEVWKSLKKLSKDSQIQLKHYPGFLGPYKAYADMSGLEFSLLYLSGLKETDSLLDIGCGALRLGRVVLPYLLPGKYHCIEPNSWLVREALHYEIGEQILWLKQPKFAFNDKFQAPLADSTFNFLIAQSIFSHTGLDMFEGAMKKIKGHMTDASVFLLTFVRGGRWPDCRISKGWIYPGCCVMTDEAIQQVATRHELFAVPLKWRHDRQQWWAWCLYSSKAKCNNLESIIPHVPHV
mmetsp:Transcript_65406/g.143448  ORF Transcript_65406/g.143448 Transcript_65406/m.143448 type:complete len:333 (-) Transcript_65406:62-1060(-)